MHFPKPDPGGSIGPSRTKSAEPFSSPESRYWRREQLPVQPCAQYHGKQGRLQSGPDVLSTQYSFCPLQPGSDELDEPSFLPAPAVGNGPGVPGPALAARKSVRGQRYAHPVELVDYNEARAGWTRLNLRAFNVNYGNYVTSDAGIPGGNIPGDILTSGLSIFSISGLRISATTASRPAVVVSDNLQFSDNVNYIHGKHSLKFGADVQRRRYNAFQSDVLRGSMPFSGAYTQDPNSRAGTGLGSADALLGNRSAAQFVI